MEQLHNGFTLTICEGAFPLSTDSIALSDFARLGKNASVLDLGSGCGTLGLLLCAKDPSCRVTGIEIDRKAHMMALENAARNGICDRLTSICGSVADLPSIVRAGSYSCCISNPPYFSAGPASKQTPTARREDLCSLDDLMAAAGWALKYGGDLFVVYRPERMAELFTAASACTLEPKRVMLLRHKADGPITLILVQCRKGAKPGLILEEAALFAADGSPTDYYCNLYHL